MFIESHMLQKNTRLIFHARVAATIVAVGLIALPFVSASARQPSANRIEISKQTPAQRQAAMLIAKAQQCNKILESETALSLSDQAIKLDPQNQVALLTRAEACKALGKLDQSIADYKLANTNNSGDIQSAAARSLGDLYFYLKRYADGIAVLSAHEKKNHQLSDGMLECRARCYMAMGKSDLAAKDLSQAIKSIPDKTPLVILRAKAYSDSHQWEKALADYNEMIANDSSADSLFGSNSELYLERSKIYDVLGKKSLAAMDRQRAKELDVANFKLAPFRSEKHK